ncbi:MAG: hypothetical protein IPH76_09960 [Xanthomonadales bacterium]|nr:hypothetical protein [Xanthomonadales bacterium]
MQERFSTKTTAPACHAVCRRTAVLAIVLTGGALASPFEIEEFTVDGGGNHGQGARFALEGSIGQPDAATLTAARFAIDGGFWRPLENAPGDDIFHDSFED